MKTIKMMMAALMLTGLGLGTAHADTKPDDPKPAQTPAPAQPTQPGQLTPESLQAMLDLLGYEVRLEKLESGNVLHWIKVRRKDTTYELNVNISPSKTKLWTSIGLADAGPEQTAQADRLLKLLEINQKIGPSHFYYYAPHKMIYVAKPMDNRGITAKLLREHIDELMEQVVANEDHWNTKKWTAAATASKTEK